MLMSAMMMMFMFMIIIMFMIWFPHMLRWSIIVISLILIALARWTVTGSFFWVLVWLRVNATYYRQRYSGIKQKSLKSWLNRIQNLPKVKKTLKVLEYEGLTLWFFSIKMLIINCLFSPLNVLARLDLKVYNLMFLLLLLWLDCSSAATSDAFHYSLLLKLENSAK